MVKCMDYIDNSVYSNFWNESLIVLCGLFEIHIKQCTGYHVMTVYNNNKIF